MLIEIIKILLTYGLIIIFIGVGSRVFLTLMAFLMDRSPESMEDKDRFVRKYSPYSKNKRKEE